MKKVSAIIKTAVCVLTVVIILTGCSQEDKLAQADANAMVARNVVLNVLDSLYQEGTSLSGSIIKGQDYNIDIGGITFNKSYLEQYFGENWHGYVFGELDDETGVAYILWSENPIPSKYKTLLTKGDQEIASKEGVDIGCYPQYY